MAIIGFAALCLVMLWLSLFWLIMAWNGLGQYNIGGVPNSTLQKIGILLVGAGVTYLWSLLFASAPFTVTVG